MRRCLHWFASPVVAALYVFLWGWWAGLAGGGAILVTLLLVRGLTWPLVDVQAERDCASVCLIASVFGCAVASLL